MQALFVLWIIVTCIYLILYQSTYWKYFFGLLIPYYLITQIFFFTKFYCTKNVLLFFIGKKKFAPGLVRTVDLQVNSLTLYRLSY